MREYLKQLRKKINFTQFDMSKALDISESYYCMIENGNRQRHLDLLLISKLSKIFNVSVEWIIEQEKIQIKEE